MQRLVLLLLVGDASSITVNFGYDFIRIEFKLRAFRAIEEARVDTRVLVDTH